MANTQNILTTEIWSDLDPNMVSDAQGSLRKVINIDAVTASISNILNTSFGERMFLPTFASTLKGMTFEPTNTHLLDRLATDIKTTIEKWDNRPIIQAVDFAKDPDNNTIKITLRFLIRSYTQVFNTTVTITQ